MDKNNSQISSRRAILVCITLISILITCGLILSIIICKNSVLWYEVAYINGNSNILVQTYQKGETLTLPANPEKVGYKFIGWSLDESGETLLLDNSLIVNNGFNLYAQWQEFKYSLLFNNSEILSFVNTITFETTENHLEIHTDNFRFFIIDNPSKEGYIFDGWQVTVANKTYSIEEFNFDKNTLDNITLSPTWLRTTCNVKIYSDNELIDTLAIYYGDSLELPAIHKEGFQLVKFEDSLGNTIYNSHIIKEDIEIFAKWEELKYSVSFEDSKGAYVIKCGSEYFSGSKDIQVKHSNNLIFSVSLSKAYNNSNFIVYAKSDNGDIYPQLINNEYLFKNITSNLEIIIDNIEINSYSITIDSKNYGHIPYGSWLWVDNNVIYIKDSTGKCILGVMPLIEDSSFGGWELECGNVLVHNYIQDLATNEEVKILGKYSKDIARITLNTNGGVLAKTEIIYDPSSNTELPTPTKEGFEFVGWFTKLVEVNLVVDEDLSQRFTEITQFNITLYAGWKHK